MNRNYIPIVIGIHNPAAAYFVSFVVVALRQAQWSIGEMFLQGTFIKHCARQLDLLPKR